MKYVKRHTGMKLSHRLLNFIARYALLIAFIGVLLLAVYFTETNKAAERAQQRQAEQDAADSAAIETLLYAINHHGRSQ